MTMANGRYVLPKGRAKRNSRRTTPSQFDPQTFQIRRRLSEVLSWGRATASPKDFRDFGLECIRWAEAARDERHRQVLVDLARQWMKAAVQMERSFALLDDESPVMAEKKHTR